MPEKKKSHSIRLCGIITIILSLELPLPEPDPALLKLTVLIKAVIRIIYNKLIN